MKPSRSPSTSCPPTCTRITRLIWKGLYYLTDVNDQYWRAQDTNQFNEKGHYVDCSPLVPTIAEFLDLPFHEGKSIRDLAAEATFYASGDGKDMPEDF